MSATVVYYVSILATLAVAVVLMFGLATMLKGRDANLSQRLMRWRIGLQFIAILVIMLFVYLTRGPA